MKIRHITIAHPITPADGGRNHPFRLLMKQLGRAWSALSRRCGGRGATHRRALRLLYTTTETTARRTDQARPDVMAGLHVSSTAGLTSSISASSVPFAGF
jgi:hypothetical protein